MRIFITIALCVYSSVAAAQAWCPPGARWKYDVGSPWSAAQVLCTYVGDTVIDGHEAQAIEQVFQLTQNFGTDTLIQHNWGNKFTRTNGDLVWEWNGAVWDTLYWFSAAPGDEWQPFWAFGEVCPDHVIHVLDTGTTVVDDVPLRSLTVELRQAGIPSGWPLTIVERIGGPGGNIFPGLPPCGAIYECYCSFMCYQDQEINADGECALPITLGMHDAPHDPQALKAFPDPGEDVLRIELADAPGFWTLSMTTVSGDVVLRASGTSAVPQVNTSALAAGTYVLRVTTADGRSRHRRWTKR